MKFNLFLFNFHEIALAAAMVVHTGLPVADMALNGVLNGRCVQLHTGHDDV